MSVDDNQIDLSHISTKIINKNQNILVTEMMAKTQPKF